MIRRTALATGMLAAGYAIAAGLFWALLNVPESNMLALTFSAGLLVTALTAVGLFTAASAALGDDAGFVASARASIGSLPAFFVGLLVFAGLWWLTGSLDTWWRAHSSEIDAISIRYAGVTRTRLLHQAVFWMTWALRWVVGLATLAALVSTGTIDGLRSIPRGLRHTLHLVTLVAVTIAIAVVWGGLWRVVYWRPTKLPSGLEPAFVAAKLGLLYLLAVAVVSVTLAACRRSARARSST